MTMHKYVYELQWKGKIIDCYPKKWQICSYSFTPAELVREANKENKRFDTLIHRIVQKSGGKIVKVIHI